MSKNNTTNVTRFDLMTMYVDVHALLTSMGYPPKEIVIDRDRNIRVPKEVIDSIRNVLNRFSFEEEIYLRVLNDQQRYFLGDDLRNVAVILNELFPRIKDLEAEERTNYREVEKLPTHTVISAKDLAYNHLAKEAPAYLRRLIGSSVGMAEYGMNHSPISVGDQEEMELVTADWLLTRKKHDEEILKILSLTSPDGKPSELQGSTEPRLKFIIDIMPSLSSLAALSRSTSTPFARFTNLLPSLICWTLGNNTSGTLNPMAEDTLMDIMDATMTFTRSLQANADKASRLRQMIHYGFPVYKELLELAKSQRVLMSWNFEAIVHRLSYNLVHILQNEANEQAVIRFLTQTNILANYAKHKDCYIER